MSARTRTHRRGLLGITAVAAVLAMAGPAQAQLAPFQTELPRPGTAVKDPVSGRYLMTMAQLSQQLHPDLPAVKVWGFNGSYPGPTIEAREGEPEELAWSNMLPAQHLLEVDESLTMGHGSSVRTQTHLHGGFVSGLADGNPYAQEVVPEPFRVNYANAQNGATLWYHDHALGLTRLNVYAGLAGFYLLRDDWDTGHPDNPLGLPAGPYEIPIVFQDRSFTEEGQLSYPALWEPEFFGDHAVINGAVWPKLTVEPRTYRFRMLNGANSRFFRLRLPASTGLSFTQIGGDGGRFDRAVEMGRSLLLAPGERADVLIDFAPAKGKTFEIRNGSLPAGVVSPATPLRQLMQVQVGSSVSQPAAAVAADLHGDMPALGTPDKTRDITLEEVLDQNGEPVRAIMNGRRFHDPVTETPQRDSTEDWRLINVTADSHPIHLHLVQFQIIDRRRINAKAYQAALATAREQDDGAVVSPAAFFTGAARLPAANERGWKDTVVANPGEVTRIRMKWTLPPGVSAPQKYVFHCHILEHEENDMMRPIEVVE